MRIWALVLAVSLLFACTKKEGGASDRNASTGIIPNAMAATETPPASSATVPDAGPTYPSTRLVGRWIKDGNAMRCEWGGCYATARFTGTAISVRVKDEGFNLLQVIVDGEFKRVLRLDRVKGETVYPLVDGLTDGVHEIEIHKRTEPKIGDILFYGFEGAKLVPGNPPPERRIETVGDSISAGYGNEGPGGACGFVNSEENEYLTYGAIAAKQLNADHSTLAWSGKTQYEMRIFLDKSLPAVTTGPKWDFAQWQPQVVVLNLGTNDFANVDPGQGRFVRQYLELMHDVRAAYPKAFVVITLGSMLSDAYPETRHNLTQARTYFKVVVQKLKDNGETNFGFLEFPEQNHADGLGCGYHPSLKTHQLMADRLTAFIKEKMQW